MANYDLALDLDTWAKSPRAAKVEGNVTEWTEEAWAEQARVEPGLCLNQRLPAVWEESVVELRRMATVLLTASTPVDDVLQDVYLTALSKADCALAGPELRRWLFRVTINRCRLEHRRQGRWRQALASWVGRRLTNGHSEDIAETAMHREQLDGVRQALSNMPYRWRSLLVLRYFLDHDSQEIGRIVNLPASTVRSQLRQARARLASALRAAGFDDDGY